MGTGSRNGGENVVMQLVTVLLVGKLRLKAEKRIVEDMQKM